jgi:hypothetical protein
MQAVRTDIIKRGKLGDKLVHEPGVSSCGTGEFAGNIKTAGGKFEKSPSAAAGGCSAVIVDVAADFPCEDVEAEIVKIEEAIVGLKEALKRSLIRDCKSAEVAEFQFGADGGKTDLAIRKDAVKLSAGYTHIEKAVSGADGVLDIIDEVRLRRGLGGKGAVYDHVDGSRACIYYSQTHQQADGSLEITFGGPHVLEFETHLGLDFLIELIQDYLLDDEGEVIVNELLGLGVAVEGLDRG